MGRGPPVPSTHEKMERDLHIYLSTVHNIIKGFIDSWNMAHFEYLKGKGTCLHP